MRGALKILEHMTIAIHFTYGDMGWECWKREGDYLPQATWKKLRNAMLFCLVL